MTDRPLGTLLVWVLAAVIATLAAVRLLSSGGDGAAAAPVRLGGGAELRGPGAGGSGAGGAAVRGGGAAAGIYVHVAGEVRRPGLVRLPAGSRAAAAIERAGGFKGRANVAAVNLAARLEDGQQVVVPPLGPAGAGAPASGAGTGAITGLAPTLATATTEDLDAIDGIGPTLAERIVKYRDEDGGLGSIDELREVDGIGEKRLEALREGLRP
ncbi:MAG TPA: helix-hairpin-helix domain-containing protein [Thermoleophilaceae bacterium]|nr:helix-hairpin-helix domain-containing protein [Thermoleophilaceae bacterium]